MDTFLALGLSVTKITKSKSQRKFPAIYTFTDSIHKINILISRLLGRMRMELLPGLEVYERLGLEVKDIQTYMYVPLRNLLCYSYQD